MSAALIDLVSVGAQDVYITGQPEVSFFRQNYKRHTNFSMKPERMDYIGTFAANNTLSGGSTNNNHGSILPRCRRSHRIQSVDWWPKG